MKRAALYIRVSTDDQMEYSPDAQKRALLEYAKRNDLLVSEEHIFIDEGYSGRKAEKRPKFMCMISIAKTKPKPFDFILVHKFDRFARSREDSIVYKSLLRKECNIQVISITEHIEDDKFSVILEAMLEAMAEYYSLNLAEEVKKGMTEKARRGEYQAAAPFGYIMREGKLYPDTVKATIVKKIFHMYLYESKNFFSIARFLNDLGVLTNRGNPFENRTVKYILKNPVYKGYVRWNPEGSKNTKNNPPILQKGTHEPIISETVWEQVNDKIQTEHRVTRVKYSKPKNILTHWLSGLIYCSNCGSVLVSSGSNRGFQCNAYTKGKCNISHYITYHKIEKAVLDTLRQLTYYDDRTYQVDQNTDMDKNEDKIIILNESIHKLAFKENRISEAYMNGIDTLDEYIINKEKLKKERSDMELLLLKLKDEMELTKINSNELIQFKSLNQILTSDVETQLKIEAIRSVVHKIIYNKSSEEIKIYLLYS